MEVADAYDFLVARLSYRIGKFFLDQDDDGVGVGQVYEGLRFPVFNEASGKYDTLEGMGYILTHECDVDQDNNRMFNADVLFCPIIDFPNFLEAIMLSRFDKTGELNQDERQFILGFLGNLARREVSRLVYIPQIQPQLPYGGVLYLNQITNISLLNFDRQEVNRISTATVHGLRIIDQSLQNHLLRPKTNRLAFFSGH